MPDQMKTASSGSVVGAFPLLMSKRKTAAYLGVAEETFSKLLKQVAVKFPKPIVMGKNTLYWKRPEVDRWLETPTYTTRST